MYQTLTQKIKINKEAKNLKMVWIGRDLKDYIVTTPVP